MPDVEHCLHKTVFFFSSDFLVDLKDEAAFFFSTRFAFSIHVFAWIVDWFRVLFSPAVISLGDYFGFGFKTLKCNY